jgi:hypothetical protein
MSKSSLTSKTFGTVNTNTLNVDKISYTDKMSVTQLTSLTSGVTLHSPVGAITTVSSDLTSSGSLSFTCTNSTVDASKYVMANIINYSGSTGYPSIIIDDVTSGSFLVNVRNNSTSAILNGTIKIAFLVL